MYMLVYTDGSCNNRSELRLGGYAAILRFNTGEPDTLIYGGEQNTSSARMELLAVRSALRYASLLTEEVHIDLKSDAEYIVKSFREGWIWGWIAMDYATTKNADLWRDIIRYLNKKHILSFTITHVKGHSGVELNEKADLLAGHAANVMTSKFRDKQWKCYRAIQGADDKTTFYPNML